MKKSIFFLLLFITVLNSRAQYFFSGDYLPKPCFETDSIIIVDSLSLTSLDHRTNYTVSQSNDTINLKLCYIRPNGPQGLHRFSEKTNIGKLAPGKYIIHIEGVINHFGTCDSVPNFFDTIYFPLEVFAIPNALISETISNIELSYNSDNIHIVYLPTTAYNLKIYDMRGRDIYSINNQYRNININTSTWSRGLYIVSLEVNGDYKKWRIFKE